MPEKEEDRWLAHKDIYRSVLASRERDETEQEEQSAPGPTLLLKFREEIARELEKKESEEGDDQDEH